MRDLSYNKLFFNITNHKIMKKTKISILALALLVSITAVFIACTKETDSQNSRNNTNLRESFLKNKDFSTVKSDFNLLDKKSKINLWNEKLNQLIEQDLPIESKNLIKKLITELNKVETNSKAISEIAVSLAKIIPEDDFVKMFTELNDYKFERKFKGTNMVRKEVIEELNTLNSKLTMDVLYVQSSPKATAKAKDCNCSWTCDSTVGGSTSNCKETQSGCGFLWAFSCDRRVF
jgi:hypothetical protein